MLILRELIDDYHRALSSGLPPEEAKQEAFLATSHKYAGERVYILGIPKAQRLRQAAKAAAKSTREAMSLGIPRRTAQRIVRGK